MNKAELVAAAAEEAGTTQADMYRALNAIQGVLKGAVAKGEAVRISGLFILKIEQKPPRMGRNPATGKPIAIPAHKAVKIKPAKELNDAANSGE